MAIVIIGRTDHQELWRCSEHADHGNSAKIRCLVECSYPLCCCRVRAAKPKLSIKLDWLRLIDRGIEIGGPDVNSSVSEEMKNLGHIALKATALACEECLNLVSILPASRQLHAIS
jgi:hypothetical protein